MRGALLSLRFCFDTGGGLHTVALTDAGAAWAWGCGDDGILGREGDELFPHPVSVGGAGTVCVAAACGDVHSCPSTTICSSALFCRRRR